MVTNVRSYGLTPRDRWAPYPLPDPVAEGGSFADWIATFPFEVRLALAAAANAGVGVDDSVEGPVFYEIEVPFLFIDSSMGAIMGTVVEAVKAELRRYEVESGDIAKIVEQIRLDAIGSGPYMAGLNKMLRWVAVDFGEDD